MVTGVCYFLFVEDLLTVLLTSIISAFMCLYGACVYAGNLDLMAGMNMMTEEQKSVYDLVAISHSAGIELSAIGLISFFGSVIGCYFFGLVSGAYTYLVLVVFSIILSVLDLNRAKYRKGHKD